MSRLVDHLTSTCTTLLVNLGLRMRPDPAGPGRGVIHSDELLGPNAGRGGSDDGDPAGFGGCRHPVDVIVGAMIGPVALRLCVRLRTQP